MKRLFKIKKPWIIACAIAVVLVFSLDQTAAMAQFMPDNDCSMKANCGTCPISIEAIPAPLSHLLPSLDFVPDSVHPNPFLFRDAPYHPPR